MTNTRTTNDEADLTFLGRAVRLALAAEAGGNLPVGAVVTLGSEVIAEAGNAVLAPSYHPGRHAETEALRLVPADLRPRGREMTVYTTLEPCVMCMGALLLHGVGRVVFGARYAWRGRPAARALARLLRGRRGRSSVDWPAPARRVRPALPTRAGAL